MFSIGGTRYDRSLLARDGSVTFRQGDISVQVDDNCFSSAVGTPVKFCVESLVFGQISVICDLTQGVDMVSPRRLIESGIVGVWVLSRVGANITTVSGEN